MWEPMKTAPRDGTPVLLRVKGKHVLSASFHEDECMWINGFFGLEVGPETRGSDFAPDGWMWIPEDAPKE